MRKITFHIENNQILAFFVKFEVIFDQLHSEDDITGKNIYLEVWYDTRPDDMALVL